jgi:TonB-dependent starch-binding outer membrane protein SusC
MKQNYILPLRGILLSGLLLLSTVIAFAQKSVSGRVSDSKGDAIPGASVAVKGTKTGTITDANGDYKLQAPNSGGTLVVSSIGYGIKEVAIGNQTNINISLEDDASALSEVVVTGYTIDNRRETTGAVSIVKAKELTVRPTGNVEQQLQGRVAGVTLITNGQPGTTSQIRVRGFGSFGGNEPLYVVDGVPVGSTDFINPNDVETVTVLKDAAAASIYGARAANGVIIYTTKKGSKGAKKLTIQYDNMFGVTTPGPGQAMMNPTDFADWTWRAYKNSGVALSHPQFGTGATPVIPDYLNVGGRSGVIGSVDLGAEKAKYNIDPGVGGIYQVVRANKTGTDWYDAITRNAPMNYNSLGFSGGGENSRFYIGLSAQNQQGILLSNDFKRYTFRANSEFNVLKNLKFGQNLQVTYRRVLGQSGENGGLGIADDENDVLQAFRMPSIIPVLDEFGGYAGTAAKGFNNPRNPVANQNGILNNRNFNTNGFGNFYLEYEPIKGLTLRSSIGGGYGSFYGWNYSRLQYENSENNSAFGYGENGGFSYNWVLTNTAAYKRAFGKHGMDVIVGQEALNTGRGRNMSANGLSPFSTDLDFVTISTLGSRNPPNSSYFKGVNFYSLFGRVNYTFNDKYIVTGVVRRDGSSRFGANNRYGVFPAFSAAWRVSSESFMKGITWINDLKVRGGYGAMGNSNNVDPNNQYSLFAAGVGGIGPLGGTGYDINGSNSSVVEGYARTRIGNQDAKWETAVTKNLGFDGTFFNGKLDVVLDFWQKDTKDLLLQLPIPSTNGLASAPTVNVAKMVNKGIDILVATKGKIAKDLNFDVTFTGGILKNEISEIASGQTYLTSVNPGYRGLTPIRNQIGQSISAFFGYKVQGLFQSQEEVNSAPAQDGKGIGRFRYQDIDGNGKIDVNDRTYLGSPVPKFTGGISLTLSYKNFDLVSQMNGFFGNKIFNASKWFTDFFPSFQGAAISERVKDSWTPQNTGATIPIFETASNFSTNTQANSFYIEDGTYVRMQTVTLGYTVPASILSKVKIERLRLFASGNNLFTLTKYQGLDPGVGGNADTQFGIDVGNYPVTKQFTFGLNLGF